jgi:hypothetical protein
MAALREKEKLEAGMSDEPAEAAQPAKRGRAAKKAGKSSEE